jgi:hypothetical protein
MGSRHAHAANQVAATSLWKFERSVMVAASHAADVNPPTDH